MQFNECKKGMKVVCISDVPHGCSDTENPIITKGEVFTIKRLNEYVDGKDGINFKEISYLWYPEDFKPLRSSIKKL